MNFLKDDKPTDMIWLRLPWGEDRTFLVPAGDPRNPTFDIRPRGEVVQPTHSEPATVEFSVRNIDVVTVTIEHLPPEAGAITAEMLTELHREMDRQIMAAFGYPPLMQKVFPPRNPRRTRIAGIIDDIVN